MSISKLARITVCASLSFSHLPDAEAQASVDAHALEHYAYCVSQAKDRNFVFDLERYVMYRCHGEVAISYFNYLGRKRAPERIATEPAGTIIYRKITGIGACWNKIAEYDGATVSIYGCDIYVEI